ncbi:glycine betaine ABC transporter substrate-binding protein [Nodosilinea sp. FACHB-13]|uniref:glycine betaine ABC transporter substrate-binding protein n=1 Tax=Cyanophyceae TaxID=3028117 RepID=UPI0016835F3B|nr:glycine betaine ABC transporter substrate-binding protein [Nodosilinea sp. FACHB-13]MBD2105477.1 quaternary ammonium transporter [Nodosilinea sp. FACHB-13]
MTLTRRWFSQACLGVATALVAVACGGGGDGGGGGDVVSVGSKDFTEQLIIGEMYALVLEENGLTVERKLNLGGTPVAQAAIESGEIDLYPEYTGTALLTVLKQPVSSDQQEVFDTVKQAYQEQFNLVWLDPSPMNNTQALAMTEERAEALGIRTISDFAAQASDLTLIGPPEFEAREDGLPGLQEAYGDFSVKEYKAVDAGLRYKGLVDGEADVAVAFGTDGEISAFNLVVLEDDKGLFPPYQVAPIVSQAALDANPAIAEALNQVSPLLNDEVMRQLNYEVSGNQREPAEVAREFLVDAGLVSE